MRLLSSTTASGATQRADRARLVGEVPLADVPLDLFERYFFSFGRQFAVAAHGADGRIGRHEDFQLGVRKNDRPDVAAVHDDSLVASHLLLKAHETLAHGADLAHAADGLADLEAPDRPLDVLAVEVNVAGFPRGVEDERYADAGQHPLERLRVDHASANGAVPDTVQRDGAIHRSGIDEDVPQCRGDLLGERAFAAGRESVDGDDDFFVRGAFHGLRAYERKWTIWRRLPARRSRCPRCGSSTAGGAAGTCAAGS